MATTNPMTDPTPALEQHAGSLLVVLPELPADRLRGLLTQLTTSLPAEHLLIAVPGEPAAEAFPGIRFVAFQAVLPSWTLTASEFMNAQQLAQRNGARGILLLGAEADSLTPMGVHSLLTAVDSGTADLVVPRYDLQPRAGLLNSSILYPLNRALFANRVRYPLSIDLGMSLRMGDRLSAVAQRFVSANQGNATIWAVSEASVAGLTISEADVGTRQIPQPADPDLNSILPQVTGSLFSDIEAKAAFWQRARVSAPARRLSPAALSSTTDAAAEVASLLQGFRLAYTNLQEIWGIVLPPNTMLGLKRLSLVDGPAFRMPENLWARIVFDFLIAYRLRTLNRGHLLGALIPLYLGWVASHVNAIAAGEIPERHVESHAAAFEAEKPYLLARWRWPDRFNP
ncbi:MAG TPA: hypothetical protein VL967_08985 [Terracidiphilus sp.]|nr:hypothetical protein [Terracidiphilus sp.]